MKLALDACMVGENKKLATEAYKIMAKNESKLDFTDIGPTELRLIQMQKKALCKSKMAKSELILPSIRVNNKPLE